MTPIITPNLPTRRRSGFTWCGGESWRCWRRLAKPLAPESIPSGALNHVLDAIREALDYEHRPDHRRFWLFLSLETATVRGIISDNLVTDPRGFRAINDEDFCAWILRHGAHPDVVDFPLVRGLYDMVFGYEDGDFTRPALAAGVALLLTGIALFQYKGAFFWKMTAGMGDVVIAPLYQALRRRGVEFEFFHRVDALHLDDRRQAIEAITMGRQARLADGSERIRTADPGRRPPRLSRPAAGRTAGRALLARPGVALRRACRRRNPGAAQGQSTSITSCWPRRSGMVELIAGELIADSPQWRDMTTQSAHRRDPGLSAVAAAGRADAGMEPPWRHDQRLRRSLRHLGVDAANAVGRAVARRRPPAHRGLLLRSL